MSRSPTPIASGPRVRRALSSAVCGLALLGSSGEIARGQPAASPFTPTASPSATPQELFQEKLKAPGLPSRITHPVTGPLPPMPDDPKNFRGTWITDFAPALLRTTDGQAAPYTPAALAIVLDRLKRNHDGAPVADSTVYCQPRGLPRLMKAVMAFRILQSTDRIAVLAQEDHEVRMILLKARHAAKLKPTYNGYSVAHWEGDVLVVDSTGFNGKIWLDSTGSPSSSNLHVVERIKKTATGLETLMTIEDPVYYTKPFTIRLTYAWRPDLSKMPEVICEENPRSKPVNGTVVDE